MNIPSYILFYVIALCYKTTIYFLIARDYCSGTERGNTRFFRLCNEIWLFIPLIIELLVLAGLAVSLRSRKPVSIIRQVVLGVYVIYTCISPLIWELPFFLASSR